MARDLRITLRDFDKGIDFRSAVVAPRPKAFGGPANQAAARALISGLSQTRASATVGSIRELAGPPSGRVIVAGTIGGVVFPRIILEFTIALGPVGSAGAFFQGSAGAGVYWWIKPGLPDEVGLWGSVGVSVTTNMGFAVGGQLSVWFGAAPVVFAGESMSVSVDVSSGALTVSGYMFYSVPPGGLLLTPGMTLPPKFPPGWKPTLIGLGFALSGGWSALPLDISVGPSYTGIKRL